MEKAGRTMHHCSSYLTKCIDMIIPVDQTLVDILKKSEDFQKTNSFPIHSTRCKSLLSPDHKKNFKPSYIINENEILHHFQNSYPVIHERLIPLFSRFLDIKKEFGSVIEKSIYEDMTLGDFVERLITKRPLAFLGSQDTFLLRDHVKSGFGGFEKIGSDLEKFPLIMKDYITYDEIKLAAMISTSSTTYLINNGSRFNCGVPDFDLNFENTAVYVGLVGARFEKKGFMEDQDIMIREKYHNEENGYGESVCDEVKISSRYKLVNAFASFYDIPHFLSYSDVLKIKSVDNDDKHLLEIKSIFGKNEFFNEDVYKKRMKISVETFLIEANHRAKLVNKKAWVHVVGLGLGVWKVHPNQNKMFMEVFEDCLKQHGYEHISDLNFSWLHLSSCGSTTDGEVFPNTNITLHFNNREPFSKLTDEDSDKIIVASWAWDGNSYVGNEYWNGSLSGSGDPAAACCSQIIEIHNPDINDKMRGSNVHIASNTYGIIHLKDYAAKILNDLETST